MQPSPNHAVERTATRRAFTICVAWTLSLRSSAVPVAVAHFILVRCHHHSPPRHLADLARSTYTPIQRVSLHNDFDFADFSYDISARTVRLRWFRPPPEELSLVEMGGFSLLVAPRDPELPFTEDSCLAAVGGVPPLAPTLDVSSDGRLGWHHVFTFMSGLCTSHSRAESVCMHPMTSNHAMERTPTRRAIPVSVAKTPPLRATRGLGGRRSSCSR